MRMSIYFRALSLNLSGIDSTTGKTNRTIVQKHKEENAFAIDDVAVNTKVFNNLLRQLRYSKYDQSMFNLLRHHSLVRPSKVQPQSKTGEVKDQREVNSSMKKINEVD